MGETPNYGCRMQVSKQQEAHSFPGLQSVFPYHTEAVLFSLLPQSQSLTLTCTFLRRESPRPVSVPPSQLVLPTHVSVVVRDMAETKGCSSTFTFCFIFIRQYKFCLEHCVLVMLGLNMMLKIMQLKQPLWRLGASEMLAGCFFLLRFLSWLADSCLLCVLTWPFSVYADPLVSVLMRTLL